MTNWFKRFTVLAVVALMAAFAFAADQAVEGTVKDAQGGILPGVSVTITNVDTGITRNVLTDDNGNYIFTAIRPGNYELKAELDQFAPFKVTDIKVSIGDKLKYDVRMQVASQTEQITIVASAEQVETTTSQLDTVIDGKRISDLPLASRNPLDLMSLAPGVSPNSNFGLSANGARGRGNNFQLDGVDNNDNTIGGAMVEQNVDATEEFRMVTATPSAEYGRAGGAVIDVIVKSGTNEFHGNLFWFNRQDGFDAKSWRENYFDLPKGSYRYDQYGATIGGPIVKDKLFFFFNTQFLRIHDTASIDAEVPTAAFRATVTNPAIANIFSTYYPLPNTDFQGTSAASGIYTWGSGNSVNAEQYTIKIDYALTSKHTISARYFHNPETDIFAAALPGPDYIGGYPPQNLTNKALAFDWTWIVSPSMVNNVKFAYNKRDFDMTVSPTLTDYNLNFTSTRSGDYHYFEYFGSGLNSSQFRKNGTFQIKDTLTWNLGNHSLKLGMDFRFASNDGAANFGLIPVLGFNRYWYTSSFLNNVRTGFVDNITQTVYSDGVTYQAGLGDYREWRSREYDFFIQDDWKIRPNLTLNLGLRMESKPTPTEAQNMYGNYPSYDAYANGYRMINPGNFFDPVNYEAGYTWADFLYTWDPSMVKWQGNGAECVLDKKIYKDHNANWGPRVGLSWDPWGNGKTAVRGGYGISFDRMFDNLLIWTTSNSPFAYSSNLRGKNNGGTGIFPDNVNYYGHGTPMPLVALKPEILELQEFPTIFDDDLDQPYIQTWNIGIQRELWPGNILEVSYVGSHGVHLLSRCSPIQPKLTAAFNQEAYANGIYSFYGINYEQLYLDYLVTANTQFNDINYMDAHNWSNYNGLQMTFNHRFQDGLQFSLNYTWAKSFDNGSEAVINSGNRQGQTVWAKDFWDMNYETGFSIMDVRHNFNASFIYELPFGPGKWIGGKTEGIVGQLIGGWQVNGIVTANSGQGLDYTAVYDALGTGVPGRPDVRDRVFSRDANRVGPTQANFVWTGNIAIDQPYYGFMHPKGDYYRGSFRGPRYWNLDFSLFKEIKLPWFTADGSKLQLRLEAFNLFNTTNYTNPNRSLLYTQDNNPLSAMGYTYSAYANREIQIGVKWIF
ncbi:MAG: TonB-dependent receptor [Acidobacteria bacterium]|nr:TonB-dependent receptor [Acidobacteriota bacterium]